MRDDPPGFSVIPGDFIEAILLDTKPQIIDMVCQGYLLHHHRKTVNPDSYFLRFDDKPEARIIALPAAVRDPDGGLSVSGIKWIGSYPRNIDANLQRASAVVILNDYQSGYPFACLEASQISAARTAASAVLAARYLYGGGKCTASLGVIGAGVIARTILAYFEADGWRFNDVRVHDQSTLHRDAFVRNMVETSPGTLRSAPLDDALDSSIVVLATTAGAPWIGAERSWRAEQVILNVSLRDLAPEIILRSNNVFDDIDHCMKANTSPHLALQRYGHRDFVSGTLAQIIEGEACLDTKKPTIFSPFGLGLLDLCVAMFLYFDSAPTLVPMLEQAAVRMPHAVALQDERRTLSFAALAREIDALAMALRSRIVPGQHVAVQLPRGLEYVVAAYAIWKAGGVYVPLDDNWPHARIETILGRSACSGIAWEARSRLRLPIRSRRTVPAYCMWLHAVMISSAAPPHRDDHTTRAYFTLDDDAFARHLVDTGGLSKAAAADPALLRAVLPLIRHDYRLYYEHFPPARAPLDVPLTVFWGEAEASLEPVMPAWAECSRAFFAGRCYPGAHFYWQTSPGALAGDVSASALSYI